MRACFFLLQRKKRQVYPLSSVTIDEEGYPYTRRVSFQVPFFSDGHHCLKREEQVVSRNDITFVPPADFSIFNLDYYEALIEKTWSLSFSEDNNVAGWSPLLKVPMKPLSMGTETNVKIPHEWDGKVKLRLSHHGYSSGHCLAHIIVNQNDPIFTHYRFNQPTCFEETMKLEPGDLVEVKVECKKALSLETLANVLRETNVFQDSNLERTIAAFLNPIFIHGLCRVVEDDSKESLTPSQLKRLRHYQFRDSFRD